MEPQQLRRARRTTRSFRWMRWTGLAGLALVLSVGCGEGGVDPWTPTPPIRYPVSAGCYSSSYQGASQGQMGCGPIPTFGSPILDQQFLQEISIQNGFWQLPTQVYAFDECAGVRNALSFPEGYILFGKNLSWSVVSGQGSSAALAGAMAHEFAHQAQFRFGWINNGASTSRTVELEADAFGGYYMVLGKGFPASVIDQYYALLQSMGDFQFNSPSHHGTPSERKSAGAIGVAVAIHQMSTGVPLSYGELHQTFTAQISSLAISGRVVSTSSPRGSTGDDVVRVTPEDAEIIAGIARGTSSIEDFGFEGCEPADFKHLWPAPMLLEPAGGR